MLQKRVDVKGCAVIFEGEITRYYSFPHAVSAGSALSWYLKADLYIDGWWTDTQDFSDDDIEFPPIDFEKSKEEDE